MSNKKDFLYYPEYEDNNFYEDIYIKKEFNRNKVVAEEFHNNTMETLCGSEEKILQPHQEFIRNYLSGETPYKGLLLIHGVGTGKCLHPDTLVYVNGILMKISDIWVKYQTDQTDQDFDGSVWATPTQVVWVNSYDEVEKKIVEHRVNRLYKQRVTENIRVIQLEDGQVLRLTKSHHLLTEKGWSNNFTTDTYVSVPKVLLNSRSCKSIGEDQAQKLGTTVGKSSYYSIPDYIMRATKNEIKAFLSTYFVELERCGHKLDAQSSIKIKHLWKVIYDGDVATEGEVKSDLQLVKITKITEEKYDGYVYDLEITDHHNYIAGGILCHNTCVSISVVESLKPRLQTMGKKVYIIAPKATRDNFLNEIYDFSLEAKEEADGVEPGAYQCTGQTYYLPKTGKTTDEYKSKQRQNQIKSLAYGKKSVYHDEIFGHGSSFPRFVEQDLPKKQNVRPDKIFSDSVIIVDEAHNLFIEQKNDEIEEPEKKEKSKIGERRQRGPEPVKKTLQTLQDIFSGYHTFKEKWVNEHRDIAKKLNDHDLEIKTTNIWRGLPEDDRKKWLKYGAKNVTIILMTATPMENSPVEFVELVNLLRLNDKKPLIDVNKMFSHLFDPKVPLNQQVNANYLCKMSKGYISYIRGQNPITFPAVFDPPADQIYNPGYLAGIGIDTENGNGIGTGIGTGTDKEEVILPFYEIGGKKLVKPISTPLKLVRSSMSLTQFEVYRDWIHGSEAKAELAKATGGKNVGAGAISFGVNGRQIGNIVFPTEPLSYGNNGFSRVFKKQITKREPAGKTSDGKSAVRAPVTLKYRFSDALGIDGLRAFIKPDQYDPNGGTNYGLLGEYSPKFLQVFNNMADPTKWGITFCYSDFVDCGAVIFAIVAELNGYARYTNNISFIPDEKTGKYPNGIIDPMVMEDSLPKGHKKLYRCYKCTELIDHPIHNMTGGHELKHKFKQGVYMIITGDTNDKQRINENKIVKSKKNSDGSVIKLILGSKASGEGINFMNVRQVHILDPWHHYQKLYQAMGRAIRHCSHVNLPKNERNVTIYKYSATVPNLLGGDQDQILLGALSDPTMDLNESVSNDNPDVTFKDLVTESLDETFYFRLIRKDILIKYVERLLKQCAIDCAFFKAVNVFPNSKFPSEVDGSRLCDYMKCDYKCIWDCGTETSPPKYWDESAKYQLNDDTYNLFFSKGQVDRVVRYLQKIFLQNWSLTLEDVVELIKQRDPKISLEYIYEGLDKMLQDTIDRPIIMDRYKREGFLTFKGDYYIVQPLAITRDNTPLYYRTAPTKVQMRRVNIEGLKPEQAVITKKEVMNVDKLNAEIVRLSKNPEIISVESQLDTLPKGELQYMYEKVFIEHNGSDLEKVMTNYLQKRRLILEVDDGIVGHYILTPRKYDSGKSIFVECPTSVVKEADKYLRDMLIDRGQESIILFDPEENVHDPPRKDIVTVGDVEHVIDVVTDRFYGYHDDHDGYFKIVDLSTETTKLTKDNKISRKTYVTGKNCVTFKRDQLVYISQVLSLNPLLTEEESMELLNPNGIRADFCRRLEKALRILNERDIEGVRWFLYPGEHRCIEHISNAGMTQHILNFSDKRNPRTCETFSK